MAWKLTHRPCKKCLSSDAASLSDTGWWHCFSCGSRWPDLDSLGPAQAPTRNHNFKEKIVTEEEVKQIYEWSDARAIKSRGISEDTARFWDYRSGTDENGSPFHAAMYCDTSGKIVGAKIRYPNKKFRTRGAPTKSGLYGAHLWRDGGKLLVITEGELDALSVSQAQGNKWPVVSLVNGVSSAASDISRAIEWVSQFDKIVLMFDMDDAGRAAVEDAVSVLPPGKAYVARLPEGYKDANDLLRDGKPRAIIDAMWGAKQFRPDQIVMDDELFDKMLEPIPKADWLYPFEGMNTNLYGIRKRELVTITAGTGVGKSHMCREIALDLLKQGAKVGYVALEEGVGKTGRSILAMSQSIPWPDFNPSEEELRRLFDNHMRGRFSTYDHFGSMNVDDLLSKLSYLKLAMGCDVVFLDHLTIVVSGMDEGNERICIDRAMTKLRSLVEQTGMALFVVSHLKKSDGTPHEEGGSVSLRDLRGSNSIAQLSDIVIGMERDQQSPDSKDTSVVKCLKSRFNGFTGELTRLRYRPETGRQSEASFDEPEFTEEQEDIL